MNNTYLFLVYSICAIIIIYLIHTIILSELNKYHIKYDYDDYDDYNDNTQMKKYSLRNTYIKALEQRELNSINKVFMDNANSKIHNTVYFTIMCIELIDRPIEECKKYDGYKEWSLREKRKYGIITIPNINPKLIRNRIIYNLQNVFPDSNITQGYKNCCDYYKITW
jgi:hypothetical protein